MSQGTVAAIPKRVADGLDESVPLWPSHRRRGGGRVRRDRAAGGRQAALGGLRAHRQVTSITCRPKRGKQGIDDAGVLAGFSGVAVDAWGPYETYIDPEHQSCCAHALRESGCRRHAPRDAQWCWGVEARDALVAMQQLITDAIAAGADTLDADAPAEQVRVFRSAAELAVTAAPLQQR